MTLMPMPNCMRPELTLPAVIGADSSPTESWLIGPGHGIAADTGVIQLYGVHIGVSATSVIILM